MTACDRAAGEFVSSASGPKKSVKWLSSAGLYWVACRKGVLIFCLDVIDGLRRVSHNALAVVGLTAVLSGVFLLERPELRHTLEQQTLTWLMDRASVRNALSAGVAVKDDNAVLLAMAEPEAILRATATNPAELNRQQSLAAYWLSRRYNVAPEPISRLVQEAWAVGQQAGLEPTLVLAVMAIESGFNPFAQSHVGAQGLMQVMTRIHHDKYEIFGGQNAAFDPVTNVRVGAQVLKECIRRAGSLEGGLKYYVGAANLADDGGYAAKVLAEQAYLRQVVAGQKIAVTSPLPQALMVQTTAAPMSPVVVEQPVAAGAATVPSAAPAAVPMAPAASETAPVAPRRAEQVALAQ